VKTPQKKLKFKHFSVSKFRHSQQGRGAVTRFQALACPSTARLTDTDKRDMVDKRLAMSGWQSFLTRLTLFT